MIKKIYLILSLLLTFSGCYVESGYVRPTKRVRVEYYPKYPVHHQYYYTPKPHHPHHNHHYGPRR